MFIRAKARFLAQVGEGGIDGMSSIYRVITAAAFMALLFCFARLSLGDEEVWETDFAAAQARAKAEHKSLFVEFSGSDWCPWCKKMQSDVFEKQAFKDGIRKRFVLVNLDFPSQKKLAAATVQQNAMLQKKYKVSYFPTICLMDPKGQVFARTGYHATPDELAKDMTSFTKVHNEILELKAKLSTLHGLERVKVLDRIVTDYDENGVENDDVDKYSAEIVALDSDNKTGLKLKYQFRVLMAEARMLSEQGKVADAKADYEKAAALPALKGNEKQSAWFSEARCCINAQQFRRAVDCLDKAREAAPQGPDVAAIDMALKKCKPLAETQQTVIDLLAQADAAQGVDRARALDKLVEAQVKFGQQTPAERHPQQIQKWSDEIIALDADNKAGLKTKYRVRELLMQAASALKSRQTEKARSAIDQARALPELTDDEMTKIRKAAEKLPDR